MSSMMDSASACARMKGILHIHSITVTCSRLGTQGTQRSFLGGKDLNGGLSAVKNVGLVRGSPGDGSSGGFR